MEEYALYIVFSVFAVFATFATLVCVSQHLQLRSLQSYIMHKEDSVAYHNTQTKETPTADKDISDAKRRLRTEFDNIAMSGTATLDAIDKFGVKEPIIY